MPRSRLLTTESHIEVLACPDKRLSETFEFRLTPREVAMLKQLSAALGFSKAQAVRAAIRGMHDERFGSSGKRSGT